MRKMIYALLIVVLIVGLFVLTGCTQKSKLDNLPAKKANTTSSETKATNTTNTAKKETTKKNTVKEDYDYLEAADKQMAKPEKGEQVAIMHIKGYGDVSIRFFKDVAPKAVENFVKHSQDGYYNGVTFHRVIEEFMIQGGDPQGTGRGGESIWGKDFEEEIDDSIKPYRGALCMASRGSKNSPSLGSQFYIVQSNYKENIVNTLKSYGASDSMIEAYKKYGGDLHNLFFYDYYTVFGQVYDGMEVVDKIAKVETDENDKPLTDVVISSIDIIEYK
jgi:cyclophilin family peptidyl-prolyl cis-trans isomerase